MLRSLRSAPGAAEAGIDARWYSPLLRPVMPTVSRALVELEGPADPWTLPRTGLGGAVVIQVARGFGVRRWRRGARVAVTALEGYNQRVHIGEPGEPQRARWLARDLGSAKQLWDSLLEHDQKLVNRVIDRLLGPGGEVCDLLVPEGVLFLRGAVAAGAVVGDVPPELHAALDHHATWLGLSWEASRSTLTEGGWEGAMGALGVSGALAAYPEKPGEVARLQARAALDALPDNRATALFGAVLDRALDRSPDAGRSPRTWRPMSSPTPRPTRPPDVEPARPFDRFSSAWRGRVEAALHDISRSRSTALTSATDYLLGQGGKRVRPLLTLAAASACDVQPAHALPCAASIEWLHQASLVLDDIIDDAALRRGASPLHSATSPAFATGVTFFLFARVLRRAHAMHPEMRQHLVRAASALAEGEQLELAHTLDPELDATTYYRIIEAKTARLFSAAAVCGALVADGPRGHVKAMGRYGREVGLAFQIVDDLLDYVGDEPRLGKRPGTDLLAGKMTLPLILLRQRLSGPERAQLIRALGCDGHFEWVCARLRHHGIEAACRERAGRHCDDAVRAISDLPHADGVAVLTDLARALGTRRC